VQDDPEKPSYCWITRGNPRPDDNPNSFDHLLDNQGRLSSLKVTVIENLIIWYMIINICIHAIKSFNVYCSILILYKLSEKIKL